MHFGQLARGYFGSKVAKPLDHGRLLKVGVGQNEAHIVFCQSLSCCKPLVLGVFEWFVIFIIQSHSFLSTPASFHFLLLSFLSQLFSPLVLSSVWLPVKIAVQGTDHSFIIHIVPQAIFFWNILDLHVEVTHWLISKSHFLPFSIIRLENWTLVSGMHAFLHERPHLDFILVIDSPAPTDVTRVLIVLYKIQRVLFFIHVLPQ